ncbi:hypothetical protein [Citrobacter phage IME-JL8]|uniref:DUF3850 domain-containing protein n=1 Tax=Citrobacter phage IME-JL8 TaxID=2709754 RepID=A0A6G6XT78_9CAUD|nr:hypothetical protein [Citrobacter phage IME-JL8]
MKRKQHDLKIEPVHFFGVQMGGKKAEFRLNDRDFQEGDVLRLREWHCGDYTGREVSVLIADVTDVTKYINRANADTHNGNNFVMLSFNILPGTLCNKVYV